MINLHRLWLFTFLLILSADSGLLAQLKTQNTFLNPTLDYKLGGLASDFASDLKHSEQLDDNDSSDLIAQPHQSLPFCNYPDAVRPSNNNQFGRYQLQPRTSQGPPSSLFA